MIHGLEVAAAHPRKRSLECRCSSLLNYIRYASGDEIWKELNFKG